LPVKSYQAQHISGSVQLRNKLNALTPKLDGV